MKNNLILAAVEKTKDDLKALPQQRSPATTKGCQAGRGPNRVAKGKLEDLILVCDK